MDINDFITDKDTSNEIFYYFMIEVPPVLAELPLPRASEYLVWSGSGGSIMLSVGKIIYMDPTRAVVRLGF